MQFFKTTTNLSYDHKHCTFSDHTNVTHNLQLKYVHHSQATSISYAVLVTDYRSSTATLSYKSL